MNREQRAEKLAAHHWEKHRDRLRSVVERERFGLICDFDGTLSAFAPLPTQAVILPENAALLDALAERVTVVALVSGRGARDLRQRFERPYAVYYGNHGLEFWRDDRLMLVETAHAWSEPLQHVLDAVRAMNFEGVIVEDKGVTGSIHYRLAHDTAATRAALQELLAPLCEQSGFRLSEGQFIWEVNPPLQVDKGTAVRAIVEEYQLDGAIFIGDDVTDYAAMRMLRQLAADPQRDLRGLSLGVVHPTSPPDLFTACDLTADGVHDVTGFLRWVLEHRPLPVSVKDKE
ncbi:MAG: trehalose-phosphatase [Anaerolinea sp.]|nr:trehalose-phosphatase [Anaerolinea sp.]